MLVHSATRTRLSVSNVLLYVSSTGGGRGYYGFQLCNSVNVRAAVTIAVHNARPAAVTCKTPRIVPQLGIAQLSDESHDSLKASLSYVNFHVLRTTPSFLNSALCVS